MSFLYLLKVTVVFLPVALYHAAVVLDVCRFCPIPETFSRLLKNTWDRKGEGTEIPRRLPCVRHRVRSCHNCYFIVRKWSYNVEAGLQPAVLRQPALPTSVPQRLPLVCDSQPPRQPLWPPFLHARSCAVSCL